MEFQEHTENYNRLLVILGVAYIPTKMVLEFLNLFGINDNNFQRAQLRDLGIVGGSFLALLLVGFVFILFTLYNTLAVRYPCAEQVSCLIHGKEEH